PQAPAFSVPQEIGGAPLFAVFAKGGTRRSPPQTSFIQRPSIRSLRRDKAPGIVQVRSAHAPRVSQAYQIYFFFLRPRCGTTASRNWILIAARSDSNHATRRPMNFSAKKYTSLTVAA